jgi:hypothetical protein
MTTSTPAKPTAKPQSDQGQPPEAQEPEAQEPTVQPAPAGQLAVVFTPEVGEATLQSCRGGAISFAFGPLTAPTTLRIIPGLNVPIDRSLWEQAKERPDTQMLMGRGLLQEIKLTDGATNADGELTLGAVPVPVAIRLVYGCRNTEQLEQWLRKEDRQQLRERIAIRIKEINDGKP